MRARRTLTFVVALALVAASGAVALGQRPGGGPPPFGGPRIPWIDVHTHLIGERGDYRGAVAAAVAAMDEAGIRTLVVMPPPQVSSQATWDFDDVLPALGAHRSRFAFLGGGGTVNPMLHETRAEAVDARVRRRFEARAEEILRQGARGFGEIAALHISVMPGHPFESVEADHPLLLLLADIAARHDVVIDLHLDLVAEPMKAPEWLTSPPNPTSLPANIGGLERLLEHNRAARIVWAHAGSDVFGHWTVDVSRRLLAKHPNLLMSLRMMPARAPQNHLLTPGGAPRPEWLALLQEFPTRFVIGGDQFLASPAHRGSGPGLTFAQRAASIRQRTRAFLAALPSGLARQIAVENAVRLYKLE